MARAFGVHIAFDLQAFVVFVIEPHMNTGNCAADRRASLTVTSTLRCSPLRFDFRNDKFEKLEPQCLAAPLLFGRRKKPRDAPRGVLGSAAHRSRRAWPNVILREGVVKGVGVRQTSSHQPYPTRSHLPLVPANSANPPHRLKMILFAG